jgi:hypothetical protein
MPVARLLLVLSLGLAAYDRAAATSAPLPQVTVKATSSAFTTSRGLPFDAQRVVPRTLIVSAEIGEGGPTGVYAVRL